MLMRRDADPASDGRIRIVHIIGGLDQGGAEAMLVRLLRRLDRDAFSQSVVSLTTRGVYGNQIEALGVPLIALGMTGFSATPGSVIALYRAIKMQQPAIVQTWLYHADLLGLVAARMAGDAAVAWNVRCSLLAPGDVPHSTRWLTRFLAPISTRPDAVLFNSTAGREAHRALGYRPRRSEVIPNGFDLEERRPDAVKRKEFREEIGVNDSTFVVGMIARFHRMKDQSTFLAAAGQLKAMGQSIRFVLVGLNHTWDNKALLAEINQYGLGDRITLLGIRQDVPRIMAGLDCLVSTSTSEGFPNVIGEAMACGVPCVATDAGDSRLIVGNTGVILPIGDVAGVVAGVSQLMAETPAERSIRSERCRKRIVDHFELGQIAGRYAEFYRELNDRRGKPVRPPQPFDAERWKQRFSRVPPEPASPRPVLTPPRWLVLSLIVAAVVYTLVFQTPLVWLAGSYLTIRQPPSRSDAIVVFSGNGESTYINAGYQRRARDAARYYQSGYAPLLVISSGIQQTFDEVEIIKALLLSQGVPANAMHVLSTYPTSTYENVQMVNDVLKARHLTSILFVTAPYHSRRASMIWTKVAPDVRVTTVPVVDTPPGDPQWSANLDQIRAIGYEYLAIVYNRAKGWL
jgi:glycosyltransferase involved in cell wall biosynthesis/uncharacterized SAM-binding protein YcdF (DUF218 family)